MLSQTRQLYEFAPYRLDPAERRLLRGGEPVALTPKCFDLLVVLVENSGHLLEKSDLLARVWPDQFVEEGTLLFNVSELRRVLGEGQSGHPYIETVRKKGFRFVAPVAEVPAAERIDAEAPARTPRRLRLLAALLAIAIVASLAYVIWPRGRVAPVEGPPRTIAVLPFKPLTANVRDEPLEIGICNSLISRLAKIEHLVVRPTSSVVAYNRMGQDPLEAARKLRVDALLEGYIQRSQDRLRVTARLLRASDGHSLWSGEFNEKFTDIFTVEDSISREIAEALHLNLTTAEQREVTKHSTNSIEAYELYLKGCYFQENRTADGLVKSIGYFEEATAKDSRYAVAFAAMANSYCVLAVRTDNPPRVFFAKAATAAKHALEIDDSTAEAHSALATVKTLFEWDWPGAEREFKRAIELSANDAMTHQQYAVYLVVVGRLEQAVAEVRRAQHLAPLSLPINVQAARILYFAGRYDDAFAECRNTLHLHPDAAGAHMFLGRIYAQTGLYREAAAEFESAQTAFPNSAELLSLLGYTYAASGRAADAKRVVAELDRLSKTKYVSAYHMAMVHAGLGERDAALQLLEKAYDAREGRMTIVRFAPEFATLRSDARFIDLMKRMKFPAGPTAELAGGSTTAATLPPAPSQTAHRIRPDPQS